MEQSKIEWTDHTHNEWIGCTKISAGCKNCYAENLMHTRYKKAVWGEGENSSRYLTSIQNRNKPYAWNKQAEKEGIRRKVFAQSLSDTFEQHKNQEINAQLIEWRIALFEKIKATPHLDWLVLTKRPEVAKQFFIDYPQFENLPNVWLGVSVENQEQANKRIPVLLEIPAKIRFLSCEPLLGSIDFDIILAWNNLVKYQPKYNQGIDWVIVGGESGADARPMHPDWVRYILYQCQDAGVPFFFKQWGEYLHRTQWKYVQDSEALKEVNEPKINPKHPEYFKVGKHIAGRLLDGKEYNEMPNLNN